jgi:hypothetical protein
VGATIPFRYCEQDDLYKNHMGRSGEYLISGPALSQFAHTLNMIELAN